MNSAYSNAGRWALGITHSTVAKEFIEGQLGWSSSDARGTISKTMYFGRMKQMDHTRWPRLVPPALGIRDIELEATDK